MTSNVITVSATTKDMVHSIFDQLTYENFAQEPVPTPRQIEFSVSDGIFDSNILGIIFFDLTNNNPLVLECSSSNLKFTEGSDELLIAQQLMISDQDQDHVITSVAIQVSNFQDGDSITVNSDLLAGLTLISLGPSELLITGIANSSQYQVNCYV